MKNETSTSAKQINKVDESIEKYDHFWHPSPGITKIDRLECYISKHILMWMIATITGGLGIGWALGSFAGSMIGASIGSILGGVIGTAHAKHNCPKELR
jgi:hypothetical protein